MPTILVTICDKLIKSLFSSFFPRLTTIHFLLLPTFFSVHLFSQRNKTTNASICIQLKNKSSCACSDMDFVCGVEFVWELVNSFSQT